MTQERRNNGRYALDVYARIFNDIGEIILGEGRIADISTGGTKLITTAELVVGDLLQIEFVVRKGDLSGKDKTSITCEVETVWKEGETDESKIYGVKFVNLSPMTEGIIEKLVAILEQDEGQKQ